MASVEPQAPSHEADEGAASETTNGGEGGAVAHSDEHVDLSSGAALDAAEALSVTSASRTHLVVLGGAPGSGKTTLLSSIYERFREGPFGDYRFAGSRTLMGFEQTCHLNRLASQRTEADTERTKHSEGAVYYHLSLQDTADPGQVLRREVLFSAISGEFYRLACDSTENCLALTFVKRADVLAVLIDGAKLTELDARGQAVADAKMLIQSFLDAGMIRAGTHVEFVVSKLDLIEEAGASAHDYVDTVTEDLLATFGGRVDGLKCRQIAARPASGELPFAYGLDEALREWLSCEKQEPPTRLWAREPSGAGLREIAHYGWRYAASRGGVL